MSVILRLRKSIVCSVLVCLTSFSMPLAASEVCLDEALDRLMIKLDMSPNPVMLEQAIEDNFLVDFEGINDLFEDHFGEEKELGQFLLRIRDGILEKHPAIVEFLCAALEEDLIPQLEEENTYILKTIYNTFLLDKLTQKMAEDVNFMRKIKTHYLEQRDVVLKTNSSNKFVSFMSLYKNSGGIFEIAKILTMDKVFDQYIGYREKGKLSKLDLVKKNFGLTLNLLEASLSDGVRGLGKNARTGLALIMNPMFNLETVGENNFVKQHFVPGWTSLYETWNLAFVTGKLDNLHIIYPKLLIPQVIDAEDDDYIFNRGLSLWITINVHTLTYATQNELNIDRVVLPKREALSRLWGEINFEYSVDLMDQEYGSYILWIYSLSR